MEKPFPAYQGDEPYVFVCYAHAEAETVYSEISALNQSGINIWYDEGISAGRVWREELAGAIAGASHVLAYISSASLTSEDCKRELHYALDHGVPILPVYLEDVPLTPDLEIGLSLVQALYRDGSENYLEQVKTALIGSPLASADMPQLGSIAVPDVHDSRWPGSVGYVAAGLGLVMLLGTAYWGFLRSSIDEEPDSWEARSITVAVMPFSTVGGDAELRRYADRVTDDVWNAISNIADVDVASNPSTVPADMTAQLQGDYLIRGSVRLLDEKVRTSVQLESKDGRLIWNDDTESRVSDVLPDRFFRAPAVASTVSSLAVMHQTLSSRVAATAEVKELMFDGFVAVLNGQPGAAYDLFERAAEADPELAGAYAWLARVCCPREKLSPVELHQRKKQYLQRAIGLAPDSWFGYFFLAVIERYGAEYESALANLEKAKKLGAPLGQIDAVWGDIYLQQGLLDEAIERLQSAIALGVLDSTHYYYWMLGRALMYVGDYKEGLQALNRAEPLYNGRPDYVGQIAAGQAIAYAKLGDQAAAERKLHQVVESGLELTPYLLWSVGHEEAARTQLDALQARYDTGERGLLVASMLGSHVVTGDLDEAIQWLYRMFDQPDINKPFIVPFLYSVDFAPVRGDPRFEDIEGHIVGLRKSS